MRSARSLPPADRPASVARMAYRTALEPPSAPLALLTRTLVDETIAHSQASPRRRIIQPFHRSAAETVHRMLNAVQPDSYVRPHRHLDPPKAEAWILLRGSVAFFTFEDDGAVRDALHLGHDAEDFGVDLVPGIYHTFVALEADTVIYEVKGGPYAPANDKAFAPWAPPEGDARAAAYMQRLLEIFRSRR